MKTVDFAISGRITLRAMRAPVVVSSASKTDPMPPSPSSRVVRYFPRRVG
jgi:hypothetical protein